MTKSYLHSTLILLSHLSLSITQLTGTITRCNHDPNLITAVITNTHTHHISVLKHNTIFDTSHQSVPFRITDMAGTRLPMGVSHLFYSGVGWEDFLDLAPGQKFTREFNLTEYVALEPKGLEHLQTIEISLPSAFQGLKDHNGVDVHPAAKGQSINGQLRLGNMTSISHTSAPFQISLPVTAHHSLPKTRREDVTGGLQLIAGTCSPPDAAKASMGMLHASYLAGAALNAASNFSEKPFNYFFPAGQRSANIVAGVMTRVIQSQLGQGQYIGVSCQDHLKECQYGVSGYMAAHQKRFNPSIVLCPDGLRFPPNPPPCSARPGTVSIGYLLLHELMHVQSISGPGLIIGDETGQTALDVAKAIRAHRDTTTDCNAYAYLGTWAWDLGLGGPPWNQQKVCLERFWKGQFRANSFWGWL